MSIYFCKKECQQQSKKRESKTEKMNSDFVTEYILKTKKFQDRYPKFVKLLEIYSAIYRKTQTSIIILDDGDSGKSIPSYGIFPTDHYPSNKSSMLEYTCFIEFESMSLKFKLNILSGQSCCSAMFHYAFWVCILMFYKDNIDGRVENFVASLHDIKNVEISGPPLQSADSLILTPVNEIFKKNEFAMYAPTIQLFSWLSELEGDNNDSDSVSDAIARFEKKYAVDTTSTSTVIDTLRKSIMHRLTSTSSSFLFPLCSCPRCKCFIMTKFIEHDKRLKLEFCDFQSDSLKFVVCLNCHMDIPKAYFVRALETTIQQLF